MMVCERGEGIFRRFFLLFFILSKISDYTNLKLAVYSTICCIYVKKNFLNTEIQLY